MLTSWDFGTRRSHQSILALPSHEAAGSFSLLVALCLGPPNFNLRLHSPLPRLSTLLCPKHYVMSFQSWACYRKWGSANFKSFALNPTCIARYLTSTKGLLNWLGCPSYNLKPSTSMCVTITFVNMFGRDLSRSFPSTLKNKSPMLLQSLWHKMTSNVIAALCVARNLWSNHTIPKHPKWGSVMYSSTLGTYLGTYILRYIYRDWKIFNNISDQDKSRLLQWTRVLLWSRLSMTAHFYNI